MFILLKKLLSNPFVAFTYGLLTKWVAIIYITGIIVVYWVFQGLQGLGVIDYFEKTVTSALQDTKSIARYCIPKLDDWSSFWDCLEHPPKYVPSENDKKIEAIVKENLPEQ